MHERGKVLWIPYSTWREFDAEEDRKLDKEEEGEEGSEEYDYQLIE